MNKCPFCNQSISLNDTICPNCHHSLIEEPTTEEKAVYQPDLFESTPEQENQQHQEQRTGKPLRMKNTNTPYIGFIRSIIRFFNFYKEYLLDPSNQTQRRRHNTYAYGYISYLIATLISSAIIVRLVETAFSRYKFLAEISILPTLTQEPNYIFLWLKLLIICAVFYFGFAVISYIIKRLILKRQRVFHYWLAQYAGMNAISFLLLLVAGLLTIIAPFGLFVVIVFLILMHMLSFVVTFIAAIYKTINETVLDHLYLSIIGLSIQLLLTLSLLAILL